MWKDIPGYENEYQMSDSAAIKRKDGHGADGRLLTEKTLKASRASNGKSYICLWKNGKRKSYMLHKIYAKTFGISEKEAVRRVYEGFSGRREPAEYVQGMLEKDLKVLEEELANGVDRNEEMLLYKKIFEILRCYLIDFFANL